MNHQDTSRLAGSRARIALLLIAGGLGCALGAGVASANTGDSDAPRLVVRYTRESLATDSGVRDLYRRIVSASRRVCAVDDVRDLHAVHLVEACRERAVARAIEQINNAQLAAQHASGSKNS
jgi:UrcA family protein